MIIGRYVNMYFDFLPKPYIFRKHIILTTSSNHPDFIYDDHHIVLWPIYDLGKLLYLVEFLH